jgi:hypothetical protein
MREHRACQILDDSGLFIDRLNPARDEKVDPKSVKQNAESKQMGAPAEERP